MTTIQSAFTPILKYLSGNKNIYSWFLTVINILNAELNPICHKIALLGASITGLFISLSGNSELDCATTKTDTAKRSISIGRGSLKVFCTRGLGVLVVSTARGYS